MGSPRFIRMVVPDTQPDIQSRNPRQGTADHYLKSRGKSCSEEVAFVATVMLRELNT